MTEKKVLLDIKNGIATVTLNAPERLNAMSPELLADLNAALDQCCEDQNCVRSSLPEMEGVFAPAQIFRRKVWRARMDMHAEKRRARTCTMSLAR